MGADIKGYVRSRIVRVSGVLNNISNVGGMIDDLVLRVFSGSKQEWEYGTQQPTALLHMFGSGRHTMWFRVPLISGIIKIRDRILSGWRFAITAPNTKIKVYDKIVADFELTHVGKLYARVFSDVRQMWWLSSKKISAFLRILASGRYTLQLQASNTDCALKARDQIHEAMVFSTPITGGTVKIRDGGDVQLRFGYNGKLRMRVISGGVTSDWGFGSIASALIERTRVMSEVDVMMMHEVDMLDDITRLERIRLS